MIGGTIVEPYSSPATNIALQAHAVSVEPAVGAAPYVSFGDDRVSPAPMYEAVSSFFLLGGKMARRDSNS